MKKIGITVFALLTVAAFSLAPTASVSRPASRPNVAEATGDGIFGEIACYSCLGLTFASSVVISPLTPALWSACGALCSKVL